MSAPSAKLMVGNGPAFGLLSTLMKEHDWCSFADIGNDIERVRALCIVPDVPADSSIDGPGDGFASVATVISGVIGTIRDATSALEQQADAHIVILLPADSAMGRSGASASAAVAGALISLGRTLAIELQREGIAVNTVLYDSDLESTAVRVVGEVETLVGSARHVSGQEIYVTSGSDLGRLHP